jgi:outer membrane receptor protein involved in Fe transport
MRTGSLILLALFINFMYASEGGIIRGKVVDSRTLKPIPNANVIIVGTRFGTATDRDGEFEIRNLPPGVYEIEVSVIGYEIGRKTIHIKSGDDVYIRFVLRESYVKMGEVEVLADYRLRRIEDVRPSIVEVDPRSAKVAPGMAEDVMRTLQTLPGVFAPADFTAQLVVRGGSPDENLIIVDGIEVYNPYRLYGFVSMFNPDAVSKINFMTGGFPAKYGDRLSAVLDVVNREGTWDRYFRGNFNISLTNANIIFEGRSPFGVPGSWLISTRRTYYDLILGPIARKTGLLSGDITFPNFYDVQTKIVFQPIDKHKISLTAILSQDAMNIISGENRERPDSISVTDLSHNGTVGLSWTFSPDKNFVYKVLASWYRNSGDSKFEGEILDPTLDPENFIKGKFKDTTSVRLLGMGIKSNFAIEKYFIGFESLLNFGRHMIEFGFGNNFVNSELTFNLKLDPQLEAILKALGFSGLKYFKYTEKYNRAYIYVQDKIKFGHKFSFQPGLRLDYYQMLKKFYLSPRFNLLYNIDPITSIRLAYGWYYQSPGYEKLYDQYTFYNLNEAERLEAERAIHYVFGLERWLTSKWLGRFEVYYKDFDNLIVRKRVRGTEFVADRNPEYPVTDRRGWGEPYVVVIDDSVTSIPVNRGDGYAYGFEILIEKRNVGRDDRLTGWISYSLAWAEREIYGTRIPFMFDQRHTFNIVMNYKLSRSLELGVIWRYGSNFPYTEPRGVKPRIVLVDSLDENGNLISRKPKIATDLSGNVILNYDFGGIPDYFNARKPPYHRLDVRLTWYRRFWGIDWAFYLDVINVYNRKNVFHYDFHIDKDGRIVKREMQLLPILPTIGISGKF